MCSFISLVSLIFKLFSSFFSFVHIHSHGNTVCREHSYARDHLVMQCFCYCFSRFGVADLIHSFGIVIPFFPMHFVSSADQIAHCVLIVIEQVQEL